MALVFGACGPSGLAEVEDPGAGVEATAYAVSGDNAAGENLSGVNLGGFNLGGANLAGTNLGATNLGGANLGGTNLAGTNLAGNNLAGNNLSGNNLAGANLAGTNLAGNNLAGNNLAATNLAASNLAGTNLAGVNLSGATLGASPSTLTGSTAAGTYAGKGTPLTGTYRLSASAFTAGNAGVDIHTATPRASSSMAMLSSGEDTSTRANSCVVFGLGSSAFSRLLEENRAGGTAMYVALKKHNWGFSGAKNAAKRVDAWEAVVWGARSYCVFILVSPVAAPQAPAISFELMAGFIKAVFRWNAPPSMTLYVGELGTTRTLVSYTGMMGAAQKFTAGTIAEKVLVSGLAAFASATTNNVSVKVDFASWVMTKAGTPLLLGNVSGAPTGVESAFAAVEDPSNGAVSLMLTPTSKGSTTLSDYASDLKVQFAAWKAGTRASKPIPYRCSDFRKLNEDFNEPVPHGKCDRYVALNYDGSTASCGYTRSQTWTRSYSQTWSTWLTTSAVKPYNDLMYAPTSTTAKMTNTYRETDEGGALVLSTNKTYDVLSETYVALNQARYANCTPLVETTAQTCARVAGERALASWCGPMNAYDSCGTPKAISLCNSCTAPLASLSPSWDVVEAGATMPVFINLAGGGAPSAGASVALSSNNAALIISNSALIRSGEPGTAALVWASSTVTMPTTVTLKATYLGVSKTATVTVQPKPASMGSISAARSLTKSVGNSVSVSLRGNASFARTVTLSSNNPNVPVPASVSVPIGASAVTFPVTPSAAGVGTNVTITATYNGASSTVTSLVTNAPVSEVESNNTAAAANTISVAWTPVTGTVTTSEHDYFKVSVPAGKTLTVQRWGMITYDSFGNLLNLMSLTDGATTVSSPSLVQLKNSGTTTRVMTIHVWNAMNWDCDCYSSAPYTLIPRW